MKPTLVILAAGLGSRYGGLKQMDKFGPSGESIIEYSIFDAIRAGFGKIVFVIRESIEQDLKDTIISKIESKIEAEYVFQDINDLPEGFSLPEGRKKPWGTAHAVLAAESKVNEPFVVINADDFYGYESFKLMADFLQSDSAIENRDYAMIGFELGNTLSDFGSVSRGVCKVDENGYLNEVIERSNIKHTNSKLGYADSSEQIFPLTGEEIVSMNFWGFSKDAFKLLNQYFIKFLEENIDNLTSEFYIPWAANEWIVQGISKVKVIPGKASWFGVTYQEDKEFVQNSLNKLINDKAYPANLWDK